MSVASELTNQASPPESASPSSDLHSAMNDTDLQKWLRSRREAQCMVGYAYANHICKVFEVGTEDDSLHLVDPDDLSVIELKHLARKQQLKRIELPFDVLRGAQARAPNWLLVDVTANDVSDWKKYRDRLFGQGRGKAISELTAAAVYHAAGGRCMYRGCGEDLGQVPLTTKRGRTSYLAHIVSSDPSGPRGSDIDSHRLSDEPENIMLMCDAHHRLIDRLDEAGHPAEYLSTMRAEHKQRVIHLLNGLKYPRTQIITLLADLAQTPTNFAQSELNESVLGRQLGPLSNPLHAIRRTQREDRGRTDFWRHLLHEHENDIRSYILNTRNRPSSGYDPAPDVLAIFPLHLVPILFMAGRIVGEARRIEVFQYDRDHRSWQWDESASPSPAGSISISPMPTEPVDEVVLSIELTAEIDENALPAELAIEMQENRMPWIRITHKTPNFNCIRTAEDLQQFTQVARHAVRIIQDQIRARRVHLFGVAPASTLFRFGQLLQAGHHPLYQLYDRPDGANRFLHALTLSGTEVSTTPSGSTEIFSIPLR